MSFGLGVALFLLQNYLPLSPCRELDGSYFARADAATPKIFTQQSSIIKDRFRMGRGEDGVVLLAYNPIIYRCCNGSPE